MTSMRVSPRSKIRAACCEVVDSRHIIVSPLRFLVLHFTLLSRIVNSFHEGREKEKIPERIISNSAELSNPTTGTKLPSMKYHQGFSERYRPILHSNVKVPNYLSTKSELCKWPHLRRR